MSACNEQVHYEDMLYRIGQNGLHLVLNTAALDPPTRQIVENIFSTTWIQLGNSVYLIRPVESVDMLEAVRRCWGFNAAFVVAIRTPAETLAVQLRAAVSCFESPTVLLQKLTTAAPEVNQMMQGIDHLVCEHDRGEGWTLVARNYRDLLSTVGEGVRNTDIAY